MIASLGIAKRPSADNRSEESIPAVATFPTPSARTWDPQEFAREQIRGLVRQVFLNRGAQETRQVVFGAADNDVDIASVCRRLGETVAAEFSSRVCLLDSAQPELGTNTNFGRTSNDAGDAFEELLTNAMLLVLPSDMEGLSVALLEAMGAGICVLASDIPENLEVVEGAGFLFRACDASDLESMLRFLLSDPAARQSAAQRGKQRIRYKYQWDEITRQIEEVYLEVMGHPEGAVDAADSLNQAVVRGGKPVESATLGFDPRQRTG